MIGSGEFLYLRRKELAEIAARSWCKGGEEQ
jgi:hypothetical protein